MSIKTPHVILKEGFMALQITLPEPLVLDESSQDM